MGQRILHRLSHYDVRVCTAISLSVLTVSRCWDESCLTACPASSHKMHELRLNLVSSMARTQHQSADMTTVASNAESTHFAVLCTESEMCSSGVERQTGLVASCVAHDQPPLLLHAQANFDPSQSSAASVDQPLLFQTKEPSTDVYSADSVNNEAIWPNL